MWPTGNFSNKIHIGLCVCRLSEANYKIIYIFLSISFLAACCKLSQENELICRMKSIPEFTYIRPDGVSFRMVCATVWIFLPFGLNGDKNAQINVIERQLCVNFDFVCTIREMAQSEQNEICFSYMHFEHEWTIWWLRLFLIEVIIAWP